MSEQPPLAIRKKCHIFFFLSGQPLSAMRRKGHSFFFLSSSMLWGLPVILYSGHASSSMHSDSSPRSTPFLVKNICPSAREIPHPSIPPLEHVGCYIIDFKLCNKTGLPGYGSKLGSDTAHGGCRVNWQK